MLEAYRKHVAERAELGTVPLPLNEKQVAELVELLKNPPAGEDAFLMDLLENRIPAGVDQAAYVKAAFLAAIVKGEATSPLISKKKAVEILGYYARWLQRSAIGCSIRRRGSRTRSC